jgi:hypothetical protein
MFGYDLKVDAPEKCGSLAKVEGCQTANHKGHEGTQRRGRQEAEPQRKNLTTDLHG